MKTSDLLRAWSSTRRRPETWRAMFDDDPQRAIRACGAAIAAPQDPRAVVEGLVRAGEYELAELLLLDEEFAAATTPAQSEVLESIISQAQAASLAALAVNLDFVALRGRKLGVEIDAPTIRRAATRQRAAGEQLLATARDDVAFAEQIETQALADRLEAVVCPHEIAAEDFERWRTSVRRMIGFSDFDAAQGALTHGPTADRPPPVEVPEPVWWPFDAEPLDKLLRWYFGEHPAPPRFGPFIPGPTDKLAWAFLAALRRWSAPDDGAGEELLQQFAAVIGGELVAIDVIDGRWGARLANLSAPGFHAFGRRRWPDGIPVEVDDQGVFIVRIEDSALRLPTHTVLAVLQDPDARRARLLAELGRQLPLTVAFASMLADESVRWARHDVTVDLPVDGTPVLLVAAPGMGMTTLLRELAAPIPGATIVEACGTSLLEAPAIFLDRTDQLAPAELRTLILEIHWARSMRRPPPIVVLAGRPELRAKLRGFPPGMFVERSLPMRSAAALREQARVTLAWVGITATRPGIHDRMAWLASGNPTLLLYLCRAIANRLITRGSPARRVDDDLLDEAWRAEDLRRDARALLWEPVSMREGVRDVVLAITDLTSAGRPLPREDLIWALEGRDDAWIDERVQLLADYGLVSVTGDSVRIWPGGLVQLVQMWRDE